MILVKNNEKFFQPFYLLRDGKCILMYAFSVVFSKSRVLSYQLADKGYLKGIWKHDTNEK